MSNFSCVSFRFAHAKYTQKQQNNNTNKKNSPIQTRSLHIANTKVFTTGQNDQIGGEGLLVHHLDNITGGHISPIHLHELSVSQHASLPAVGHRIGISALQILKGILDGGTGQNDGQGQNGGESTGG